MTALVSTQSTTVVTTAVSVSVIRVGGKQMTLALFRQVNDISTRLFSEWKYGDDIGRKFVTDIVIKFEPWGRVRYQLDNGNDWIVGSYDGCLMRMNTGTYREILELTRCGPIAANDVIDLPQLFIAI